MKRIVFYLIAFIGVGMLISTETLAVKPQNPLTGAWSFEEHGVKHVAVFVDGYFSYVKYGTVDNKFHVSRGGPFVFRENVLTVTWEYDTEKAAEEIDVDLWLGVEVDYAIDGLQRSSGRNMLNDLSGSSKEWTRIDDGTTNLAGVWRISGRKQDDEIRTMPLRARRTLKILTGTRFQWVAINRETGVFSGTGGGTYTFENGTYVEHIEFFSRDSQRVGASLRFNGKIEEGLWHHSGLSSTGNPIYEIWQKLEKEN